MNRSKLFIVLSLFLLMLAYLYLRTPNVAGQYQFNQNFEDYLTIFEDGTWQRNIQKKGIFEKGTWHIDGNHIWLDNWKFHNESFNPEGITHSVYTSFSLEKSITGKITKIYTGLENDIFFARIDS